MLFKIVVIASAVMMGSASASASERDSFETFFTIAQANAETEQGAAYDVALAMSLRTEEVKASIQACLRNVPEPESIRGYFSFRSATDYSLILMPESPFSKCLAKSLEGRPVPAPPTVPYFTRFVF